MVACIGFSVFVVHIWTIIGLLGMSCTGFEPPIRLWLRWMGYSDDDDDDTVRAKTSKS